MFGQVAATMIHHRRDDGLIDAADVQPADLRRAGKPQPGLIIRWFTPASAKSAKSMDILR
jgi:hypothetical protein